MPKLLKTAYPAAFVIAGFAFSWSLQSLSSVHWTVLRTSACLSSFEAAQPGKDRHRPVAAKASAARFTSAFQRPQGRDSCA